MKTKLTLNPQDGGPFNCLPAREVELDNERIMCNDVRFPWERHPYNMRLWVIGNEFGALGAVWASHEQDALDELIDSNLGNGLLIEEKDADEETIRLGNAGEPCNLDNAWMQTVRFTAEDYQLIAKFAEARGANADTLDS